MSADANSKVELVINDDVWIETVLFLGPLDVLSFRCVCQHFSTLTNPNKHSRINSYWQSWCKRVSVESIAWNKLDAKCNWYKMFGEWVTFLVRHKYLSLFVLRNKPFAVTVSPGLTRAAEWPKNEKRVYGVSRRTYKRWAMESNAIMKACKEDNLTVVKLLLLSNKHVIDDPNHINVDFNQLQVDETGEHDKGTVYLECEVATLLNYACYYNSLKIATFLLTKDINCHDDKIINKHKDKIENKDNSKQDIKVKKKEKEKKEKKKDNETVEDEKKTDIDSTNVTNEFGLKNIFYDVIKVEDSYDSIWSSSWLYPLGICCLENSVEIAKLLLKHPKVSSKTINKARSGIFALSIQCLDGISRPDILKLLLKDERTNVNSTKHWTKDYTALHKAVVNDDLEIAKLLLESGKMDVNLVDIHNQTALTLAVQRKKREKMIQLLASYVVEKNKSAQ